MEYALISILSGTLIIIGALGSLLPILPGLPVSLVGLGIYAWYTGFHEISTSVLVVFAILVAVTIFIDVFAPALAAAGRKSSRYGIWGAVLGSIFGIFLIGPIGILVGPFLGAFFGEMIHTSNAEHALRVAWAACLGLVVGSIFKLIVGFSMLVTLSAAIIQHLI